MRFLNRLKTTFAYNDIKGLLIYIAISSILLLISLIHPIIFIIYLIYLYILYKNNKTLFVYAIIISIFLFITYFIHYLLFNSYSLSSYIEGIVSFKEDNYLLVKEKGHYIKIYSDNIAEIRIGDKISASIKEVNINARNVENTFSYLKYKMRKKIYSEVSSIDLKIIKHSFSLMSLRGLIIEYIDNKFGEYGSLYIKELVLGFSDFNESLNDSIKNMGIIYLFAISGLHITIITRMIKKLLLYINIPSEINSIIISIILVLYMFISSSSISIKRAIFMNVIITLVDLLKGKISPLDSLSISLFINLILNPFEIFSLGIYLSYLSATLLLINEFKKNIKTSIYIISFSIPILLYFNHEISIFIIIYSIVFTPIFSYFLIPITYLTFIFQPLSFIYEFIIKIINYMIGYFDSFNLMIKYSIPSVFILIIVLMLVFKFYKEIMVKKKIIVNLSIIALVLLINYFFSSFTFTPKVKIIDVGQGDSILLRSGFKIALIDTGNPDKYDTTIDYLKSLNVRKIDYVFISHTDNDHIGEIEDIKNSFKVKKMYIYEDGLDIKMGAFHIKSYSNYIDGNPNDSSMCLYIEVLKESYLFTGDIEKEGEKYILSKDIKDITYLKVAHHGSNTSSCEELISKLKPKVSLISVGLNNNYNHPSKEVLDRLNKYSKYIYRTDLNGSINITHFYGFSIINTYMHSYVLPINYIENIRLII